MRVGSLVLRRHVLLQGLAGAPDSQPDEGVGEENDSAGDDIAEEEEADDVAHGHGVLAGSVPVDATSCAVRLGPVLPPARQGAHGENARVAPDPRHQHIGVAIGKLVTCGREPQIRGEITTTGAHKCARQNHPSATIAQGQRGAPARLPQVVFGGESLFRLTRCLT